MCIFSLYRNKGKVVLTHNRDEDFYRKSSPTLITQEINNIEATFPLDILGQGTWILTSKPWTSVILNGALEPHKRNPPYKHSRGEFPFRLLQYKDVDSYVKDLDLIGIEPFTQIILDHISNEAWCLRWNQKEKTIYKIEESLFVTSSSTLYSAQEKAAHAERIKQIGTFSPDNVAEVHQAMKWKEKAGYPRVRTTSMVQIQIDSHIKQMQFTRYNI